VRSFFLGNGALSHGGAGISVACGVVMSLLGFGPKLNRSEKKKRPGAGKILNRSEKKGPGRRQDS